MEHITFETCVELLDDINRFSMEELFYVHDNAERLATLNWMSVTNIKNRNKYPAVEKVAFLVAYSNLFGISYRNLVTLNNYGDTGITHSVEDIVVTYTNYRFFGENTQTHKYRDAKDRLTHLLNKMNFRTSYTAELLPVVAELHENGLIPDLSALTTEVIHTLCCLKGKSFYGAIVLMLRGDLEYFRLGLPMEQVHDITCATMDNLTKSEIEEIFYSSYWFYTPTSMHQIQALYDIKMGMSSRLA